MPLSTAACSITLRCCYGTSILHPPSKAKSTKSYPEFISKSLSFLSPPFVILRLYPTPSQPDADQARQRGGSSRQVLNKATRQD